MATPTLNGITLSGCESIAIEKAANIVPLPIPGQDSDQTQTYDLLGVVKTISVTGTMALGSTSATKTRLDSIEALASGLQSASVDFVSDQSGTVQVKVGSVRVNWQIPGLDAAQYDIKLIEGQ